MPRIQALGDGRYLDAALRAAEFIKANLYRDGVLYRRTWRGMCATAVRSTITPIPSRASSPCMSRHSIQGGSAWPRACRKPERAVRGRGGRYHYTPRDAEHLIARVKDFFDGAMPNSNAVSALNLLRLHRLTRDDAHLGRALGVFGASAALMRAHPSAFSQMLIAPIFICRRPSRR